VSAASALVHHTFPMDPFDARATRTAYEVAADEYESRFADDLAELALDRAILDTAAEQLRDVGPVLDIGCGPGQVSRHLADRGVRMVGVDLTPAMLTITRRRNPDAHATAADMRALPFRSRSCAGAIAFYSMHHLPRSGNTASSSNGSRSAIPCPTSSRANASTWQR
jgi:ubiquinone/menaquinone biosynthesis C-methylase UbiE